MTAALPLAYATADRPLRAPVVGIDLSLASTGVALLGADPTQPPFVTTVGSKACPDRLDAHLARHRSLVDRIATAVFDRCKSVAPDGVALVVLEGPSYASKADTSSWRRAHIWWELAGRFHDLGVPIAVCPPSVLKKFVTGKGTAKKLEVALAVQRAWPELAISLDDEADAIGLAALGAVALGRETALRATQARRDCLAGVQWPDAERGAPVPF
ncbi:hypothetical protein [Segniliparus rugosus]|uniref:Uncharacterized protein n=1 Tax=Segniliparus rugosus (strain ATCC BAA-974 / DSM 45345 / CCUG 50838 / CIP 108380 / JCM 13579 / CDC 945) TaxID=679197 RepID=U1N963_SEGRC|nr:hypothetical protein [Segniliparus rugosus]ERG69343.1 hypothetical protein HMPREF9336_04234 [Segniliparus rugosus ATCC BAA-974]